MSLNQKNNERDTLKRDKIKMHANNLRRHTYGHVPDLLRLWAFGDGSVWECSSACGIKLLDNFRRINLYSGLSTALLHTFNVDNSLSEPHHSDSIDNILSHIKLTHHYYFLIHIQFSSLVYLSHQHCDKDYSRILWRIEIIISDNHRSSCSKM